jgi:hypothetical protein
MKYNIGKESSVFVLEAKRALPAASGASGVPAMTFF